MKNRSQPLRHWWKLGQELSTALVKLIQSWNLTSWILVYWLYNTPMTAKLSTVLKGHHLPNKLSWLIVSFWLLNSYSNSIHHIKIVHITHSHIYIAMYRIYTYTHPQTYTHIYTRNDYIHLHYQIHAKYIYYLHRYIHILLKPHICLLNMYFNN